MTADELLDRYVQEIALQLPKGQREDVRVELRALLDEMVEERAAASGRRADEGLVIPVLLEFGRPDVVADRYGRPRTGLIGPQHYPTFVIVAKVLFTVIAVVHLAAWLWSIAGGTKELDALGTGALDHIIGFGSTVLLNLGLLTVVFFLIERFAPDEAVEAGDDWDPTSLPAVADPDRVARDDRLIELCIDVGMLYWLNIHLQWRGAMGDVSDAIFAPTFGAHVPWINSALVASAILGVVVLAQGRWRPVTRVADALVGGFSAFVLMRMLIGPPMLAHLGFNAGVKVGVVVVLVIVIIELSQQLGRAWSSITTMRQVPATV